MFQQEKSSQNAPLWSSTQTTASNVSDFNSNMSCVSFPSTIRSSVLQAAQTHASNYQSGLLSSSSIPSIEINHVYLYCNSYIQQIEFVGNSTALPIGTTVSVSDLKDWEKKKRSLNVFKVQKVANLNFFTFHLDNPIRWETCNTIQTSPSKLNFSINILIEQGQGKEKQCTLFLIQDLEQEDHRLFLQQTIKLFYLLLESKEQGGISLDELVQICNQMDAYKICWNQLSYNDFVGFIKSLSHLYACAFLVMKIGKEIPPQSLLLDEVIEFLRQSKNYFSFETQMKLESLVMESRFQQGMQKIAAAVAKKHFYFQLFCTPFVNRELEINDSSKNKEHSFKEAVQFFVNQLDPPLSPTSYTYHFLFLALLKHAPSVVCIEYLLREANISNTNLHKPIIDFLHSYFGKLNNEESCESICNIFSISNAEFLLEPQLIIKAVIFCSIPFQNSEFAIQILHIATDVLQTNQKKEIQQALELWINNQIKIEEFSDWISFINQIYGAKIVSIDNSFLKNCTNSLFISQSHNREDYSKLVTKLLLIERPKSNFIDYFDDFVDEKITDWIDLKFGLLNLFDLLEKLHLNGDVHSKQFHRYLYILASKGGLYEYKNNKKVVFNSSFLQDFSVLWKKLFELKLNHRIENQNLQKLVDHGLNQFRNLVNSLKGLRAPISDVRLFISNISNFKYLCEIFEEFEFDELDIERNKKEYERLILVYESLQVFLSYYCAVSSLLEVSPLYNIMVQLNESFDTITFSSLRETFAKLGAAQNDLILFYKLKGFSLFFNIWKSVINDDLEQFPKSKTLPYIFNKLIFETKTRWSLFVSNFPNLKVESQIQKFLSTLKFHHVQREWYNLELIADHDEKILFSKQRFEPIKRFFQAQRFKEYGFRIVVFMKFLNREFGFSLQKDVVLYEQRLFVLEKQWKSDCKMIDLHLTIDEFGIDILDELFVDFVVELSNSSELLPWLRNTTHSHHLIETKSDSVKVIEVSKVIEELKKQLDVLLNCAQVHSFSNLFKILQQEFSNEVRLNQIMYQLKFVNKVFPSFIKVLQNPENRSLPGLLIHDLLLSGVYTICINNGSATLQCTYRTSSSTINILSLEKLEELRDKLTLSEEKDGSIVKDFMTSFAELKKMLHLFGMLYKKGHLKYYRTEYQFSLKVSSTVDTFKQYSKQLQLELEQWKELLRKVREQFYYLNLFKSVIISNLIQLMQNKNDDQTSMEIYQLLRFYNSKITLVAVEKALDTSYQFSTYEESLCSCGRFLETIFSKNIFKFKYVSKALRIELLNRCKYLDILKSKGRITLVIAKNRDETLKTLCMVYALLSRAPSAPSFEEILICDEYTDFEAVSTFLNRWIKSKEFGRERYIFCLCNFNLLAPDISLKAMKYMDNLLLDTKSASRLIVITSDARSAESIKSNHFNIVSICSDRNEKFVQDYVTMEESKILKQFFAATLQNYSLKCLIFYGIGNGKTQRILKLANEHSSHRYCHTIIDEDSTIHSICQDLTNQITFDKPSIYHIELYQQVAIHINSFLIQFLLGGQIEFECNQSGGSKYWRRRERDIICIEYHSDQLLHAPWMFHAFTLEKVEFSTAYYESIHYTVVEEGIIKKYDKSDSEVSFVANFESKSTLDFIHAISTLCKNEISSFLQLQMYCSILEYYLKRIEGSVHLHLYEKLKQSAKNLVKISKNGKPVDWYNHLPIIMFDGQHIFQIYQVNQLYTIGIVDSDGNISEIQNISEDALKDIVAKLICYLFNISSYTYDYFSKFILSIDLAAKILIISLKIRFNIPIVEISEPGSGKLEAYKLICSILGCPPYSLNVYNGMQKNAVMDWITDVQKQSKQKGEQYTMLFIDQLNQEMIDCYKAILVDRTVHGKVLDSNVKIVASSFTNFQSKNSVMNYCFSFGTPDALLEKRFIQQFIKNELNFTDDNLLQLFSSLIHNSHKVLKQYTNLRDVRRTIILFKYFEQNLLQGYTNMVDKCTKAMILSLGHCYYFRLEPSEREQYIKECNLSNEFLNIIQREADIYSSSMLITSDICMNQSLKETIYLLIVAIINKIPIYIYGINGSGKTTALSLIVSNFMSEHVVKSGKFSAIESFSYTCSSSSSAFELQQLFDSAKNYEQNNPNTMSLVILNELALLEYSPAVKVLKKELRDNKVAVVGLSNEDISVSLSSHFLFINRPNPTVQDLKEVLITFGNSSVSSEGISKCFETLLQEQQTKQRDICVTMRDFFAIAKFLGLHKQMESDLLLANAIQRNIYFETPQEKHTVLNKFFDACGITFSKSFLRDNIDLIKDNLKDNQARHVMIFSDNNDVLNLLFDLQILSLNDSEIIFDNSTTTDDKDSLLRLYIRRIKVAMAQGKKLVLVHCNTLYESLYDVFNMQYVELDRQKYVNLKVGIVSKLCKVHPNFKMILIVNNTSLLYSYNFNRKGYSIELSGFQFEKYSLFFEELKTIDLEAKVSRLKKQVEFLGQSETTSNFPILLDEYFYKKMAIAFDLKELDDRLIALMTCDGVIRNRVKSKEIFSKYFDHPDISHNNLVELFTELKKSNPSTTLRLEVLTYTPSTVYLQDTLDQLPYPYLLKESFKLTEEDLDDSIDKLSKTSQESVLVIQHYPRSFSMQQLIKIKYLFEVFVSNKRTLYPNLVIHLIIIDHLNVTSKDVVKDFHLQFDKKWKHIFLDEIRCWKNCSQPTLKKLLTCSISNYLSLIDIEKILNQNLKSMISSLSYPSSIHDDYLAFVKEKLNQFKVCLSWKTFLDKLNVIIKQFVVQSFDRDSTNPFFWSEFVCSESRILQYLIDHGNVYHSISSLVEKMILLVCVKLIATLDRNGNLEILYHSIQKPELTISENWMNCFEIYFSENIQQNLIVTTKELELGATSTKVIYDANSNTKFPFSFIICKEIQKTQNTISKDQLQYVLQKWHLLTLSTEEIQKLLFDYLLLCGYQSSFIPTEILFVFIDNIIKIGVEEEICKGIEFWIQKLCKEEKRIKAYLLLLDIVVQQHQLENATQLVDELFNNNSYNSYHELDQKLFHLAFQILVKLPQHPLVIGYLSNDHTSLDEICNMLKDWCIQFEAIKNRLELLLGNAYKIVQLKLCHLKCFYEVCHVFLLNNEEEEKVRFILAHALQAFFYDDTTYFSWYDFSWFQNKILLFCTNVATVCNSKDIQMFLQDTILEYGVNWKQFDQNDASFVDYLLQNLCKLNMDETFDLIFSKYIVTKICSSTKYKHQLYDVIKKLSKQEMIEFNEFKNNNAILKQYNSTINLFCLFFENLFKNVTDEQFESYVNRISYDFFDARGKELDYFRNIAVLKILCNKCVIDFIEDRSASRWRKLLQPFLHQQCLHSYISTLLRCVHQQNSSDIETEFFSWIEHAPQHVNSVINSKQVLFWICNELLDPTSKRFLEDFMVQQDNYPLLRICIPVLKKKQLSLLKHIISFQQFYTWIVSEYNTKLVQHYASTTSMGQFMDQKPQKYKDGLNNIWKVYQKLNLIPNQSNSSWENASLVYFIPKKSENSKIELQNIFFKAVDKLVRIHNGLMQQLQPILESYKIKIPTISFNSITDLHLIDLELSLQSIVLKCCHVDTVQTTLPCMKWDWKKAERLMREVVLYGRPIIDTTWMTSFRFKEETPKEEYIIESICEDELSKEIRIRLFHIYSSIPQHLINEFEELYNLLKLRVFQSGVVSNDISKMNIVEFEREFQSVELANEMEKFDVLKMIQVRNLKSLITFFKSQKEPSRYSVKIPKELEKIVLNQIQFWDVVVLESALKEFKVTYLDEQNASPDHNLKEFLGCISIDNINYSFIMSKVPINFSPHEEWNDSSPTNSLQSSSTTSTVQPLHSTLLSNYQYLEDEVISTSESTNSTGAYANSSSYSQLSASRFIPIVPQAMLNERNCLGDLDWFNKSFPNELQLKHIDHLEQILEKYFKEQQQIQQSWKE